MNIISFIIGVVAGVLMSAFVMSIIAISDNKDKDEQYL